MAPLVHDICGTKAKRIRSYRGQTRFVCKTCHRNIEASELAMVDDDEVKDAQIINHMREDKAFTIVLTPAEAYDIVTSSTVDWPDGAKKLYIQCYREVHGEP